jgi:hypothetical protein
MSSEEEVKNLIAVFPREKTFAEFVSTFYKDKFVELYVGDTYENISTEQISTPYPAVFCGKVVAAFKECLIIQTVYVDQHKKYKLGNLMFISERAIRALSEVNGNGLLEDMFLQSKETLDIYEFFKDKK